MKVLPSAIWGGMADNETFQWDYYNNCWDVAGQRSLPTSDNSEQQQQQPGK